MKQIRKWVNDMTDKQLFEMIKYLNYNDGSCKYCPIGRSECNKIIADCETVIAMCMNEVEKND